MWAAVWGRALSCNNKISFDSFPLLLEWIAGFNSLWSVSQYVALVTVVPHSWQVSRIGPWESQKTQLSCRRLRLEFLCYRRWWMLPLHSLLLAFGLIMMNPYFIISDYLLQKVVTFFTITGQVSGTKSKPLCLCSSVSSLGNHVAHTLLNLRLSWIRKLAEPTLTFSLPATSSTVILLFSWISSRVLSSFLVVVAVAGCLERSASVTLVWPFSNISIHS